MTFKLKEIRVTGSHVKPASVIFNPVNTVIWGPSDTGKSYIFECVNYCLGSDDKPDEIPNARGYELVHLEIEDQHGRPYTIIRALVGGSESIYQSTIDDVGFAQKLDLDCNALVKLLSGVEQKAVLRKAGVKGDVTAGDIRHWTLLSQTDIVAKKTVLGDTSVRVGRAATLSLLLTGIDDSAIQLGVSSSQRREATGGIDAIENVLASLKSTLPDSSSVTEVRDALGRVDETLNRMSHQQESRAHDLKQVRQSVARYSNAIRELEIETAQSAGMVARFRLLEKKYKSDLSRLVAVNEGVAVYRALEDVPCPLCGTLIENQVDIAHLDPKAATRQQQAFAAEAGKIQQLSIGLVTALTHEESRLKDLRGSLAAFKEQHEKLERLERQKIDAGIIEYNVSPKELATRRSELFSHLQALEEIEKLTAELSRLKAIAKAKNAKIERATALDGAAMSEHVLSLLNQWGFSDIHSVRFNPQQSDIEIQNRKRTSYGQGTRAVFLAAYYIGLLEHCVQNGRPHPGLLVIDSPLKNYADKKQTREVNDPSIPVDTVRHKFYDWLSGRTGPGQLVVLENEDPAPAQIPLLSPTEFTKDIGNGRFGFYPVEQIGSTEI